eukprot:11199336-Karenia_brevis.AAC.1
MQPSGGGELPTAEESISNDEQQSRARIRREARVAGAASWLFSRGIGGYVIHPQTCMGQQTLMLTDNWSNFVPEDGPIYTDGSCID